MLEEDNIPVQISLQIATNKLSVQRNISHRSGGRAVEKEVNGK